MGEYGGICVCTWSYCRSIYHTCKKIIVYVDTYFICICICMTVYMFVCMLHLKLSIYVVRPSGAYNSELCAQNYFCVFLTHIVMIIG